LPYIVHQVDESILQAQESWKASISGIFGEDNRAHISGAVLDRAFVVFSAFYFRRQAWLVVSGGLSVE